MKIDSMDFNVGDTKEMTVAIAAKIFIKWMRPYDLIPFKEFDEGDEKAKAAIVLAKAFVSEIKKAKLK